MALSEQAHEDITELQEILNRLKDGSLENMYSPNYGFERMKMDAMSMLDFVLTEYKGE